MIDVAEPNVPLWDDHPWTPLPRIAGDHEADVCVVGLGGSGLTAVDALLDAGVDVIGIDAAGAGAGAAGRNGGFLIAGSASFYHDDVRQRGRARALRDYTETLDELDRIVGATPAAVVRNGSLRIGWSNDEVDDCRAQFDAMQADGLPVEWYEGPQGVGLLMLRDAAMNPLLRVHLLAARCMARGARLFEHSPAVEIRDGLVRTPHARIRARRIIVAVDGRLDSLVPKLAGKVQTVRLQMLGTAPAPEVSIPRPVYARYGWMYWQQLPDRRVVLGGFRDAFLEAETTSESAVTQPLQEALDRFLRDELGVQAPITHRWAGLVGYTPDREPLAEEVRSGVLAIGGYSGVGNLRGALLGRAAARWALAG